MTLLGNEGVCSFLAALLVLKLAEQRHYWAFVTYRKSDELT